MEKKENLPPNFEVLYRLGYSPLHQDYLCFCKTTDGFALVYFDGIEEIPTRIENFYEIK